MCHGIFLITMTKIFLTVFFTMLVFFSTAGTTEQGILLKDTISSSRDAESQFPKQRGHSNQGYSKQS